MQEKEIREKTAQLGSDVTFFTGKPLALCTGRGEKIKEIEKNFDFFAILLLPDIIISTKKAYQSFVPNTQLYEKLRTKTENSVNRNEGLDLQTGVNMLAESVFSLHPELKELKDKAETLTGKPFYLTGSGAGLYTVFAPEQSLQIKETKDVLNNGVSCTSITACNNRW
jgi:4-diphosphocytidyl-2-C-methyl-D-erythritol kinase